MATAEEVLHAALALGAKERMAICDTLWDSLPTGGVELKPGWPAKFERRVADYDAGHVGTVPWDQARAAADRRLADESGSARG